MNVLSLFDGISCGRLALERANIKVDNYYASEIDKFALKCTMHNWPDNINLGDVRYIEKYELEPIDLLIGGSPCSGFSCAGKQLNFNDERSKLFFDYIDCLNHFKPKYFLLENVPMKKEYQDIISSYLGVEPIVINSNLVSAQNRKRLYWTNIPDVTQPEDKGIYFGDIREYDVLARYYFSEKAFEYFQRNGYPIKIINDDMKFNTLVASMSSPYSTFRNWMIPDENGLRRVTPLECERLQTLPDNYTSILSNTQRYKTLGNGWTVAVISHILNFAK